MESFFEYYTRPSIYILNLLGALIADNKGQYFVYFICSIVSIIIMYILSLEYFDRDTALGTVIITVFSAAHINYSMKVVSSIPSFTMIVISVYFFLQSHYGNKEKQNKYKILAGLFIGIAFTCHNSAGPFPFVYIITEFYILITDKESRKGWGKRFLLLLFSMAIPLVFWEGICYGLIRSGEILSPRFKHYFWRLIGNESLTYFTEDISPRYLLSMFLRVESVLFPSFIIVALIGFSDSRIFKMKKKHKTFMFMTLTLIVFLSSFPKLCCTLRQLFPLYVFIIPIAGLGFSVMYKGLMRFNVTISHVFVLAVVIIFFYRGYSTAVVISSQQKIPKNIFNVLKEKHISKIITYGGWASLELTNIRPWPAYGTISDETGYTIQIYNPYTPAGVLELAKKKSIRYLLANYYDYEVRKGWARHFMFPLHDKGVKAPVFLWKPEPDSFPLTYFDELPYKLKIYDKLYKENKIPLPSRDIIYSTMLYELSNVVKIKPCEKNHD